MKKEIIGTKIEVIDAKNQYNRGIGGVVEFETKHTLKINTGDNAKVLFKKDIKFQTIR